MQQLNRKRAGLSSATQQTNQRQVAVASNSETPNKVCLRLQGVPHAPLHPCTRSRERVLFPLQLSCPRRVHLLAPRMVPISVLCILRVATPRHATTRKAGVSPANPARHLYRSMFVDVTLTQGTHWYVCVRFWRECPADNAAKKCGNRPFLGHNSTPSGASCIIFKSLFKWK